jgi:hypothetical protein
MQAQPTAPHAKQAQPTVLMLSTLLAMMLTCSITMAEGYVLPVDGDRSYEEHHAYMADKEPIYPTT